MQNMRVSLHPTITNLLAAPFDTTGVVGQAALRGGQVRGGLRALRRGPGREAAAYRGVVLAGRGEDEAGTVAGVPAGLLDGGTAGAGGRGGMGKHVSVLLLVLSWSAGVVGDDQRQEGAPLKTVLLLLLLLVLLRSAVVLGWTLGGGGGRSIS